MGTIQVLSICEAPGKPCCTHWGSVKDSDVELSRLQKKGVVCFDRPVEEPHSFVGRADFLFDQEHRSHCWRLANGPRADLQVRGTDSQALGSGSSLVQP